MTESLRAAGITSDGIRVFGTTWCPDCLVARRVLDAFDLDYEWIDITGNDEAIAYVQSVNRGHRSVPTIVLPAGRSMTEPSGRELTGVLMALGYEPRVKPEPARS
jgi:glutaredoxin